MNTDMHDSAGHLTALGWTMFVLYLAAALLSFRAAKASVHSQPSVVRVQQSSEMGRIWVSLGVILAALGLNKPLNLQTVLIEFGRRMAGGENLSAYRAELHALFFLGFILAFMALVAVVLFRLRAGIARFARRQPLATGGCGLICIYILLRAASIDRVDQMQGFNMEHIPFLWPLEAGGLVLIIVQALRKTKS